MKFLYNHKEDTCDFQLDKGVLVQLAYLNPPFHSTLRLIKNHVTLQSITLKNDGSSDSAAEKINLYFSSANESTDSKEDFVQKLITWKLPKFAERVQEAIQAIDELPPNLTQHF